MISFRTPASTANLGPGFDCLGLALTLYNRFRVEIDETDRLDGCEERFQGPGNLFLQGWHDACALRGCGDRVHAVFDCAVPAARGLGSSASLYAAGLYAFSALHGDALDKEKIFQLTAEKEGHPDNAAPCVFGGLNACLRENGAYVHRRCVFPKIWRCTVLIPDAEIATEQARAALPEAYPRAVAAENAARAILTLKAIETGDETLLRQSAKDRLHEPYRSRLIPFWSEMKAVCESDTGGVLLVSGSGSACFLLSRRPLSAVALARLEALPAPPRILRLAAAEGIARSGREAGNAASGGS